MIGRCGVGCNCVEIIIIKITIFCSWFHSIFQHLIYSTVEPPWKNHVCSPHFRVTTGVLCITVLHPGFLIQTILRWVLLVVQVMFTNLGPLILIIKVVVGHVFGHQINWYLQILRVYWLCSCIYNQYIRKVVWQPTVIHKRTPKASLYMENLWDFRWMPT